jgi:hypothetical protein
MQARLQHPDTIEALFTMARGDTELVARAIDRCADRLDAAQLLKSVEYIIAHRKAKPLDDLPSRFA